ncbi:hypothetical protein RvY_08922 [Ramazzottius varieornatus]|uniref:UEV domain-containing protein n=1 Tax=Ramazzottius varieornatus TaxID=947166 RepID=A0A1D1V7N9_RAMVA|nr:hypothetical protein RvY_08922 [Ramazzottius varieornatus]
MAGYPPKELESVLQKKYYKYPQLTAKDAQKVIAYYPDLRTLTAQYVFPDGLSRELLNLTGTLPITYKGNTYNIPVEMWIMDTHPYNPPLCYVKPTADMRIKSPHRHVDQNGRIYLPYLTDWNHAKSDLLECCHVLVMIFSEEPPVYAKKASRNSQASPQTVNNNTGYPQMPVAQPPANPAYPAYPAAAAYPAYNPPPVFPQYPPVRTEATNPAYPASGAFNPPTRSSFPYNQPAAAASPSYPPAPSPYGAFSPIDSSSGRNATISNEHIRASLLSAVEEKLGRRLNDSVVEAQGEITVLTQTYEELKKGRKTLDDIFEKLDKEQRIADTNICILTDKLAELRAAVDKASSTDPVEVDDLIVPTAPLYKQLLTAYAEESALEDAMYYIGEALRRNVIDLDVFLKHVRELSRRQFMQRALIQKCRDKAGLP